MSKSAALGIDIGGTKTRVAVVEADGTALNAREVATAADAGADPGLSQSLSLAQESVKRARDQGLKIRRIGIGMPEYVDLQGFVTSRDVMAWNVQPMELFADIGLVTVESDVRCGALAEAKIGAGRSVTSFLYVSVGTGISCTLVIDGKPWTGAHGNAIALGELPVESSLQDAGVATLEQFASGQAIKRRYQRLTGELLPGAREVVTRAAGGDSTAREVLDSSAVALGAGLSWAVSLLDPALVVVGGGLGTSSEDWIQGVREAYRERSLASAASITMAALGPDSGVIGAGLAALGEGRR